MRSNQRAIMRLSINDHTRWNRKVKALALKGFSVDAICEATGLTRGQVVPRLAAYGISLNGYRRGASPEAKRIIEQVSRVLGTCDELLDQIKALGGQKGVRR